MNKTVKRTSDLPLVSVIVTTKNNHATLEACLRSISEQLYPRSELIVVDNSSSDDTKRIARRFTSQVYDWGPERSAQRNYGVRRAAGQFVLIIDSDMELDPFIVPACVAAMKRGVQAHIISEESFGQGFWAQCKRFERSFYTGMDAIEAARFFRRRTFLRLGGYNEALTGGEDWDLTNRVREIGTVDRVEAVIFHNEGCPRFLHTVRKMYYYARHAGAYFAANPGQSPLTSASGPLARFRLFFSRPRALLRHPLLALGMLTLKTAEYTAAGFGYTQSKSVAPRQLPNEEDV
ncbi:MAG TPA: glycosyltransferase family 2 protein [Candidatus Saccharimonadales bacterium]|nr:glycosyltransferase family 2 protein [Candidatus Saccharimonadales bacterium]